MAKLFANSGDPDQMPCSAASDLGLHCLPITLLRVFRLQWVKHLACWEEISADDILKYFGYFSPENRTCHFMQNVKSFFSGKK